MRRDAPEIAQQFLAGEFVRHFKNGKAEPDLKAAEISAGIRKEGDRVRKTDPLAHIKRLSKGLTVEQLKEAIAYFQSTLNSMEAK